MVLLASAGLWFAGQRDVASWVSLLGTVSVLYLMIAYIVAVDPKRRWPEVGWLVRLGRVFFFVR